MKVFGCLFYSRNTNTGEGKFEVRGRPGVFIGYPHGKKRYKIFDTHIIKITVSGDVKFVENIIPSNPKK